MKRFDVWNNNEQNNLESSASIGNNAVLNMKMKNEINQYQLDILKVSS